MRCLFLLMAALIGLNSFSSQLTIINKTGIPVQMKINKDLQLMDVTKEESFFQIDELESLRFFAKYSNVNDSINTDNRLGLLKVVDIYDIHIKFIFFQFSRQSQIEAMDQFGFDGMGFFNNLDYLSEISKSIVDNNVPEEVVKKVQILKEQITNFYKKIESGFEKVNHELNDHIQNEKNLVEGIIPNSKVSKLKRKKILGILSKETQIDTSLISKELSDVKVTLILDEKKEIVFIIEKKPDNLIHFDFSAKDQNHQNIVTKQYYQEF